MTRIIRNLGEEQKRSRSTSPFFGTGISPDGVGGLRSNNYAAGETGYAFTANGNAEFNNLTLRGGIIGNQALTSPVAPGSIYDSLTNFALTPELTNIRTTTITVPTGFTRAAVSVTVRVQAFNNTEALDYLYAQANIAGYNGYALPLAVTGSGGSGINTSPFSTVLSALVPGGRFTVQIAAGTAFTNWAANPNNTAEVSGSLMWFR